MALQLFIVSNVEPPSTRGADGGRFTRSTRCNRCGASVAVPCNDCQPAFQAVVRTSTASSDRAEHPRLRLGPKRPSRPAPRPGFPLIGDKYGGRRHALGPSRVSANQAWLRVKESPVGSLRAPERPRGASFGQRAPHWGKLMSRADESPRSNVPGGDRARGKYRVRNPRTSDAAGVPTARSAASYSAGH